MSTETPGPEKLNTNCFSLKNGVGVIKVKLDGGLTVR